MQNFVFIACNSAKIVAADKNKFSLPHLVGCGHLANLTIFPKCRPPDPFGSAPFSRF
jgi:hypothetical protein